MIFFKIQLIHKFFATKRGSEKELASSFNYCESIQNRRCELGNKTHCDMCSSKAMRKARLKKEQKEAPQSLNVEVTESSDETVAPPAPTTPHHHDDGIFNGYKIAIKKPHTHRELHQFPSSKLTKRIFPTTKKNTSTFQYQRPCHTFF